MLNSIIPLIYSSVSLAGVRQETLAMFNNRTEVMLHRKDASAIVRQMTATVFYLQKQLISQGKCQTKGKFKGSNFTLKIPLMLKYM